MTVCFCGHRDMYANQDALRVWLENSLKALIERGANRFYLGGYDAFDSMAAVTLRDMHAAHACLPLSFDCEASIAERQRESYSSKATKFDAQMKHRQTIHHEEHLPSCKRVQSIFSNCGSAQVAAT